MKAIIYTSNTGFTEKYAKMLSEKTKIPCYNLNDAQSSVDEGADIIYFGWLKAGTIVGYKRAVKSYNILAVCGVGMGASGAKLNEVRQNNKLISLPVFVLQGGCDYSKLSGLNKIIMFLIRKTAGKTLAQKTNRTQEENDMLELLTKGGDRVTYENLEPVINLIENEMLK